MSLKWKVFIAFIAVAGIVLPWPLFAGVCAQRVVKHRVVSYQPVYAQPVYLQQLASPYYYTVGSEFITDALAEKLAEKLALRIEERIQAQQRAIQPPPQASIVAEKCAKCHRPNSKAVLESEAPAFFSEAGELIATPEQRAAMRVSAKFGSMPPAPAEPLDDDSYLALVQELKQGIAMPSEQWRAPPESAPMKFTNEELEWLQKLREIRSTRPESIPEPPPPPTPTER